MPPLFSQADEADEKDDKASRQTNLTGGHQRPCGGALDAIESQERENQPRDEQRSGNDSQEFGEDVHKLTIIQRTNSLCVVRCSNILHFQAKSIVMTSFRYVHSC